MICVHCGKEIDNGQAFCPYCGSRVGGDAAPEAKAAKKDPRKLALPVAAVALLAVVGVGLANRMPSIDLQRYVTITAQGYDTLGKLDVSFDTDKLEADYGKRIADSFKKAMNDHKESTYGLSSLAADLYSGSETELFVDYCATGSAGAAVPHPASIAAAIRQDRGITFFFIMIFSFVFVLLTPTL